MPVLESMACGTPVICSDTTALPEVAGGAARLVPPLEVEAWVEALDTVLSDENLQRRMSEASLQRAAHFSWAPTVEKIRETLGEI